MARETIKFDGWELTEGTVRNWEVRDGMGGVAGMVGDNLTVANRSGEVWRPKTIGPGRFTVQLWLAGRTVAEAQDAWRILQRAVYRTHRLVRVSRTMASGEVVYCDAEVVGQIEPTHLGQTAYRASINFNVPAGVWYSEKLYAHETPSGAGLPKTLYLNDLAPSTAPLEHLSFTIFGRITNPKLIDNTDGGIGDTLLYKGTIPANGWIRFNAASWSVEAGQSWTNNAVTPTGRKLMALSAARPGDVPSVRIEGTNGDAKTHLRVYGSRAYLC